MELRGQRVLVVGLGRSGVAAARLLLDRGARVVGNDLRSLDALSPEARALKDRGVATELVFYPREGHGFQEYYHRLDRMKRQYEWIARHTLGPPPGAAPTPN